MWKSMVLSVLLMAAPLAAADLTKLTIVVSNLDGKPIDRASVIVKFVEGRSKGQIRGLKVKNRMGHHERARRESCRFRQFHRARF